MEALHKSRGDASSTVQIMLSYYKHVSGTARKDARDGRSKSARAATMRVWCENGNSWLMEVEGCKWLGAYKLTGKTNYVNEGC